MRSPVGADDGESPAGGPDGRPAAAIEITRSREAEVGGHRVRRALPRRARRTVGAWCFIDHMGPTTVAGSSGAGIGPHPHTGLQTVTWLVSGELRHRDSLGSDQVVKPGELNLMTAGDGVAHAEEGTTYRGELHGVQLWVAQPDATRHGPPAFEHHAELPRMDVGGALATVLVGELDGAASTARRDTDHSGFELLLQAGRSVVPLRPDYEHAVVVVSGAVLVDGSVLEPGRLGYLSPGRDQLVVESGGPTRALVVGGVPFPSPIFMWWNFVARTREEAEAAGAAWNSRDGRFGEVDSTLDRIAAPVPPWSGSGGSSPLPR